MVSILNKPSSLIHEICIEKVDRWKLFKFSESLQQRMEELLEKKKADKLMAEEVAELDTIGELDRIFTHINAMMVAQDVNQPYDRQFQKERAIYVNTVILQNV
ncbi:hypothetical protein [Lyngbya sp. CCAP 1446/10]|uniref:hypothetical protein n=1 Tax=Lyngbya sp. CCAP 1446/10 TaxID=439293 RepID=UPI002237D71B|nr:hypothetical protein [Lyngbya sp. CCAP 1446/10]